MAVLPALTSSGHAVEDDALIELIRERGIGLEINLTSNVHTNSVRNLAEHPLARFFQRELLASINTDDPVISGIDLYHEFTVAAPAAGITCCVRKKMRSRRLFYHRASARNCCCAWPHGSPDEAWDVL